MPDAKDNAKASGDVHPPEIEDAVGAPLSRGVDGEGAEDGPPDSALSRDLENEGRAGKGVNQAGYLKDKDAPGLGRDKP
ncbi:MAG: hypothetical protein JWQ20_4509 [Conexibacter sp.]|nr:hypothetical protein [Conexibacter sp.]